MQISRLQFPGFSIFQKAQHVISLFLIVAATALFTPKLPAQTSLHSPGWVVISVEDYRSLRTRAFPTEREPSAPPVDATLTRVDYDIRIDHELASGRATLTVDVLKDGWVRVPVPPGLLVREARLDGKLVSLVPGTAAKGSQLSALLSHPGRSTLQLDIALPVNSSAGQESISVPSTASGITRASVQLPRQGVDVRLTGGLLAEKSETAAESKWLAYGRGNEPLTFTWRRKTEDHHVTLPLRLRGSLTELVNLAEDSTPISAEVNLEITQGAAREVKIQVPNNVTINHVLGAMVADWQIKDGQLAVTFLEPVEQNARFVITAETRSPRDGIVPIPLLRLTGAERDTGGVAVEVLGAGEIKDIKPEGLENADASDLGEMISSRESPSLAAFKFRSGAANTARSLSVNIVRYTPQAMLMANIEEARYRVLLSKEGKTLIQARYAIRNNQRNFLKLTLPAGANLWSASLAGKPVRPGQSPDGALLLPLEKARAGEDAPAFAVEVVYLTRATAWTDKGRLKLPLPVLDLPISRTGLQLYHPPLFKLTSAPGPFRTEPYEDPSSPALTSALVRSGRNFAVLSGAPATAPQAGPELKDEVHFPGVGLTAEEANRLRTPQSAANQAALDKFREKSKAGKVSGILPIRVSFPEVGPSLFLVSELTAENQVPNAELSYQREKKGGVK
jgi:hypothetical protein